MSASERDVVSGILADYEIPDTTANRANLSTLLGTRGEEATRLLMSAIHGSPEEVAAGAGKRVMIGKVRNSLHGQPRRCTR